MSKLTPQQQKQLDGLVNDTIIPALFEDFNWLNQDQLDTAVNYLKRMIDQGTTETWMEDDTETLVDDDI